MKFKLDSPQVINKGLVSYSDKILTIGSCFSDEIGQRMSNIDLTVSINPAGTLFSAEAIQKVLNDAIQGEFTKDHLLIKENQYLHYDYHSSVSGISESDFVLNLKVIQNHLHNFLLEGNVLMITLGTAWSYRLKASNKRVANCHKMPACFFDKDLLEPVKLFNSWQELIEKVNKLNPKLKIIFTVSPVRHSKDGLRENNISKGLLQKLVWDLEQNCENIYYFPAYEIVLDELRDYRFYKEDLVHPSKIACDYVFEQFCLAYFDLKNLDLKQMAEKIKRAENHKHVNSSEVEREQHDKFIEDLKLEFKKVVK